MRTKNLNFKLNSMKRTRFTETQIVKALKDLEGRRSADDLSRERDISKGTLYRWKSKYGVMESSDLRRLKDLEEENARLKRMYANLAMELDMAKYIIEKKL